MSSAIRSVHFRAVSLSPESCSHPRGLILEHFHPSRKKPVPHSRSLPTLASSQAEATTNPGADLPAEWPVLNMGRARGHSTWAPFATGFSPLAPCFQGSCVNVAHTRLHSFLWMLCGWTTFPCHVSLAAVWPVFTVGPL